ncbi:DUF4083 family protein [Bacillus sp. SCS-153A]|uniref:DUF4083 family protein n=1 Tax=Rossellomorea sedimentorum TaxID=3115294 RepID=UPI0039063BDE
MFLLQASFNVGDILFQLIMFILLLAVPAGVILLVVSRKKQNAQRLDRIEEKVDRLLKEKDK